MLLNRTGLRWSLNPERRHYAGFFDPGFGYDPSGRFFGSRAALEVRAHDVPFMIEHGQRVSKLTLERMVEPPNVLYGQEIGSSYQQQIDTLSKHFRSQPSQRPRDVGSRSKVSPHPALFDDPG